MGVGGLSVRGACAGADAVIGCNGGATVAAPAPAGAVGGGAAAIGCFGAAAPPVANPTGCLGAAPCATGGGACLGIPNPGAVIMGCFAIG